jgi:uncharacterized membrane protein
MGMLGNTGNDLIFKVTAGKIEGRHYSLFYLLQAFIIVICSLSAVWILNLGPIIHASSLLFGLPIGVGTWAVYTLVLNSLAEGDVSTNVTIFRLNFVVSSALAAVILDEVLSVRKIIGLMLCCTAILILFFSTTQPGRRFQSGLRFSIPACLLAGGLNILIKAAFNNGALIVHLILYRYLMVSVLTAVLHFVVGGNSGQWNRQIYLLAFFSGAAMMFSLFFTFAAFRIGDVALVTPINQLAFVFSTFGAVLILKEKITGMKILALLMAVASIVTIA